MTDILTIGALADETRCSIPTIRYYEQVGLMPEANRRPGGHRFYGEPDLKRLTFIRRCRDFGFSIGEVKALVALMDSPSSNCKAARDIASGHLIAIHRNLKELRALEKALKSFVTDCDALCAGGPAGDCVILDELQSPKSSRCCG